MDENKSNNNFLIKNTSGILIVSVLTLCFVTPIVTYDGWQYISSGKSLFDGTYASNYFFVRQPLYPLFIGACLAIVDSLWFVIFMQYFINILCLTYFINLTLKDKRVLNSARSMTKVKICIHTFCWIFLGSFPSYILAQNLFLPFFLMLTLYLFKTKNLITKKESNIKNKTKHLNFYIPCIFILTSFLLAKEVFVITIVVFLSSILINKNFRLQSILSILLGLILVLFSSLYLNHITITAKNSTSFNQTNNQDPFANQDLFGNLKASLLNINPPYTQRAINSFGSLTDLTPTIGWNGLIVDIYKNPNHPMRTFGLNHILQFGQECNSFPETGVIAVNKEYLSDSYFNCFEPIIKVPQIVKGIAYLGYLILWPLFVLFALSSKKQLLNIGLVAILFLFTYSLMGAGISRYGYPIYPVIILMAIANFNNNYGKIKSND